MMKKLLSVLLTMMILACQLPVVSLAEDFDLEDEIAEDEFGEEAAEEEESEEEEEPIEYPDELIVGHPTATKGDFFTEMFGNDTADIDVRALIHGYNLVNWDQNQGVYVIDPTVVSDYMVRDDEYGNRIYYIAIEDDLMYSDGTPITAWDYAFSLLLMMAPEIEQIGGKIYRAEHILGYDDYITKKVKSLGGVRVLDDYQLEITLDADFLPYFFEVGLLLCVPYPIKVIAPGCKVYTDEYGCIYIGNEDQSIEEPIFTAELLAKTVLDPETGYNSHPSVVSGPYVMTSFDGVTSHFEINPYFKGAWFHNSLPGGDIGANYYTPMLDVEGNQRVDSQGNPMYLVKPVIEKICFTTADNDTMIQQLEDGELHLVNKVTYGPTILEGMQSSLSRQNYARIGLSFLTFSYDWPTVHDMLVRQAIAWCMDREQLTQDYCQGFGMVVNGYYGMEQWEYKLVNGELDYPVNFIDEVLPPVSETMDEEEHERREAELLKHRSRYVTTEAEYEAQVAAWQVLTDKWKNEDYPLLESYGVDLDKANRLLDKAGWTLNREGGQFTLGVDDVRCQEIDGELVALDLKMMYPEGNHIVDTLQENFIDNLNACGILLTLVPTPMVDLLHSYYRETERTTDMIYLATNFHVIVDPSITYSTDNSLNHQVWNNTYSDDEYLFQLAQSMRKTEPMDVFEYVSKWVEFQDRYNEVLPTIPVYTNIYFDFYTTQLQGYWITGQVTWSQAILLSYFGEAADELEDEEADEFEDDDMMEFDW